MWCSQWFHPHGWPVPLCADCNCTCRRRGVDHAACVSEYEWTGRKSSDTTTSRDGGASTEGQLRLPF